MIAPFGRIVVYGARNIHDTLSPDRMTQLIRGNRTLIGFNFPSLRPEQIEACVPELLDFITRRELKIFASNCFAFEDVVPAFQALSSRNTVGRVVLLPNAKRLSSGIEPGPECQQECTVR